VSLDGKTAPLSIGTPAPAVDARPASAAPASAEGQKLARVAGEFESMLLLQMLREMRKSGSWQDEDEEKSGFGAETLFDTIDMELASYITKSKGGFGLEKSLVKQVSGSSAVDNAVHTATASKPKSGRPSARLTVRRIMFGLRRAPISRNQESNGRHVKIENRAMNSWNAPSHRRPPT